MAANHRDPIVACSTQNARPFMLNGVWVGWADVLPDLVGRPGLLDAQAMTTTARLLDARLPRA